MRVTHLGHSCLLIQVGDTRILIDPGTLAEDFTGLRGLDAVLVTHQHADHVDQDRLPVLLAGNPHAVLATDPESAALAAASGIDATPMRAAGVFTVGEVDITPVGQWHAVNHDDVPTVTNVGVVLRAAGEPTLFHPGDALDADPGEVDLVAVPMNAPWCAVRDTIGFVRRVGAPVGIPIHTGLLSPAGREAYAMHVRQFGGVELRDLVGAGPTELS